MSQTVTITRSVTTRHSDSESDSESTIILNIGYLKTLPGILKVIQLILGGISLGIVLWFHNPKYQVIRDLFFLEITTTFFIGTVCLLLSCLCSLSTGGIISKTIYELIYHTVACILIGIASVILLVDIYRYSRYGVYNDFMNAAIISCGNSLVYAISAVLSGRSYGGI